MKKKKKDIKKDNFTKVKKAILTELEKKKVNQEWVKNHLIITKL